MTAYKDDKLKAYAEWSINVSSILQIKEPMGDILNDAPFAVTTAMNGTSNTRNRLKF